VIERVIARLVEGPASFLLVAVFTLQWIVLAEVWYWAVLTLVIGALVREGWRMWLRILRKEQAAVFQVLTGTAGQYQDADQGQRDE
jgi:hypothetical protein